MAQAPFVLNPALTAVAVDYAQQNAQARGYIADMVMPRARAEGPVFRYAEYPIAEAFTVPDTAASRLGKLNEIINSAVEATGAVLDWGLRSPVPYRDQAAAVAQSIPMDPKARAVMDVTDKVQLARETRVASLVFTAANYQATQRATLSGTGQWSDTVNSDPVAAITDAASAMLVKPNTIVMGQEVWNIVRRHPRVGQALGGSQSSGRYVPMDEVATLLGVEKIIVGNTLQQTSRRGQALTTGRIWGKHCALLNVPPAAPDGFVLNPAGPYFGATFQWGDRVAGEEAVPAGEMGLWGGVYCISGESLVERVIANWAGYLFTNAVA